MASIQISQTVTGSQAGLSVTRTATAAMLIDFEETIAAGAVDTDVNITLDVSELEFFILLSDQPLTLETNSGGAPAQTIALAANVPLLFTGAAGETNPLTVDVTSFFFTNNGALPATVRFIALQDPTP